MKQVWLKAEFGGTHNGERLLITLPDNAALAVAQALDAEFRDMHLAIEVWVAD